MASTEFKIDLDMSDLDVAQEKAERLKATLQDVKSLQIGAAGGPMTDEQIKHMTEQFLRWKLPESFNPDGGITFDREYQGVGGTRYKREPVGTNLLDATQARAMVLHMLDGLPAKVIERTDE